MRYSIRRRKDLFFWNKCVGKILNFLTRRQEFTSLSFLSFSCTYITLKGDKNWHIYQYRRIWTPFRLILGVMESSLSYIFIDKCNNHDQCFSVYFNYFNNLVSCITENLKLLLRSFYFSVIHVTVTCRYFTRVSNNNILEISPNIHDLLRSCNYLT